MSMIAALRYLIVPALVTGLTAYASLHPWPLPKDILSAVSLGCETVAWLSGAWLASRLLDIFLPPAGRVDQGRRIPRLLSDLLHVVLYVLALVGILAFVFQQPVSGLLTTSSVVIAVLGFALRNVFADIFAGIALNMEHPFRLGDWVDTGNGVIGRVEEINWRATRLATLDGVVAVLPNGGIAGSRFLNLSRPDPRMRIQIPLVLDQDIPHTQARRILMSAMVCTAEVLSDPAPDVVVDGLTPNGVSYVLRFWVASYPQAGLVRDRVSGAVLDHLERAGIILARPKQETQRRRPRAVGTAGKRRGSGASRVAASLLRGVSLLADFDDEEIGQLAQAMVRRELRAGSCAVRQGDSGKSLFLVAEGVLDVVHRREDGTRMTLARMRPGDMFGEMSLLTEQPRSADVVARIDAVVFELGKEHLDPVLENRPELREGLTRLMAARQQSNEAAVAAGKDAAAGAGGRGTAPRMMGRLRAFFGMKG